jgi:hypothetical protein
VGVWRRRYLGRGGGDTHGKIEETADFSLQKFWADATVELDHFTRSALSV